MKRVTWFLSLVSVLFCVYWLLTQRSNTEELFLKQASEIEGKKEELPERLEEIQNLVSRTIKASDEDLPMTIPHETSSKGDVTLLISIEPNGGVKLNSKPKVISIDELRMELRNFSGKYSTGSMRPIVQIYAASEVTQQKVMDVLNEIKGANINTVTFIDNESNAEKLEPQKDEGIEEDIVVPSIPYNSVGETDQHDRIVVNIDSKGSYSDASGKSIDELRVYLKKSLENILKKDANSIVKMHLRGDNSALYKHSKNAIKEAAEAGISKIIFSVSSLKKEK